MSDLVEIYFRNDMEFRGWLHQNHNRKKGVYLIFYTIAHEKESMRWEEAVRVALCYGWIDSTVKSLGNGKRRQYFCPRKPKSVWSKVNKTHVKELITNGSMHESGLAAIEIAKANGSWVALDDVENGVLPLDLEKAFNRNKEAFDNYTGFTRGQRKSYLYWLNQAKRDETREKRIEEIVRLCEANQKYRNGAAR
ncbi:YdeI/OmpD-associated family protein [Maribacter sp. 2210JD10-5]|uniref:YdeI/OmpD-associated family protein n=1 Tax=Maribacter sp. 2210JD10-5 TaxID=3386272 RepID=UPI0039BD7ED5